MNPYLILNTVLVFAGLIFMYCSVKLIFKSSKPTFDHYANLSFIQDIKLNNHRFILRHSNVLEDKNFAYPLLFHWLLSFLPMKYLTEKYLRVNLITELAMFGSVVTSVIFFFGSGALPNIGIIFLLAVTTPFNRFIWNAKVSGLSARNFGLFIMYLFLLYFSSALFKENVFLRLSGFAVLGFLVILSGQFTTQFLLIFSVVCIFLGDYFPLCSIPLSLLCFYVLMPKVFLSYLKGQYMHKKIWILHISKIDLLQHRYSIYRDFFYDFYKKKNLKYFLTNPFIEVITGFPVLVAVFCFAPSVIIHNPVFLSAGIAFILTSFSFTRFFGEPQRYIELALPVLIFFAVAALPPEIIYSLVILNLVMFVLQINTFADFNHPDIFSKEIRSKISTLIRAKSPAISFPVLTGNNWSMPAYFLTHKDFRLMIPVFTKWEQYGVGVNEAFPDHLFSLAPKIAIKWVTNYRPNWFFLDAYYWPQAEFESEMKRADVNYILRNEVKPVLLYELIYD